MNSSSTDTREIRKFGIMAFVFFGILCAIAIWRRNNVGPYIFGTLSLLGVGFILLPSTLGPVYAGWLKIANTVGKITTIIILTIAYYLVVTPIALIKYIFSDRPIPITPREDKSSYWITRDEPAQPKERFIKRY